MINRKIILASKSPRRSQLLREAGFEFEVKTREIEESYPPTLAAKDVAAYLAVKKALGVQDFIEADEIMLTSDTVVVLGDEIFGKPKDFNDAKRILRKLSGKAHQVITGVCLLSKNKKRVFEGISTVHFNTLSETEIEYYINEFKPYDKAGAYAIQEWIGLCKVKKIEGTYSNIMGLPIDLVYKELKQF